MRTSKHNMGLGNRQVAVVHLRVGPKALRKMLQRLQSLTSEVKEELDAYQERYSGQPSNEYVVVRRVEGRETPARKWWDGGRWRASPCYVTTTSY